MKRPQPQAARETSTARPSGRAEARSIRRGNSARKRRNGATVPAKEPAIGIYAAPRKVRDTIERCLSDKKKNWSYRDITDLVFRRHRYRMSIMAVCSYRKRLLAADGEVAGNPAVRIVKITVPAGVAVRLVKTPVSAPRGRKSILQVAASDSGALQAGSARRPTPKKSKF